MANETSSAWTRVELPFPDETPRRLRISIGPGKLTLRPGDPDPWVSGSVRADDAMFPPKIELDRGDATLTQKGGGSFRIRRGISPNLELALGSAQPYALTLEGGANDINCDLGGLPLEELTGDFGAGRIKITCSAPNPVAMKTLAIHTGATDLTLSNLANFNAEEIIIEGGAAAFHIDFGGELLRDCQAKISTGVASLSITLPRSIAARVSAGTTLGSLTVGDGFMTKGGGYWTEAALIGNAPVLNLTASSSLGSLKLLLGD
ncbi:MAG: hypothetical protein IT334_04705 [Thermomicrobiales bacterium]|nr:hypothetical protein [Thermomicrobiales bacterium]